MRFFTLVFALAQAVSVSGAELRLNFGDYAEGSTPTNFSSVLFGGGKPGAWKVAMDAAPSAFAPLTDKAPSVTRHGVLAQTSQDMTDERFPMFVYDPEVFSNFKLTTRFKIVSGVAEQMAGVVFRYQNSSNFYVVRASALGKNIGFYKVINGQRVAPVILTVQISTNVWHELTVDCSGIYIECSLDGQKVLPTITDKSPPDGKVGFWTKSDSVSYFSDTVVNYKPRIPVAQALVNSVMEKQPRIVGLRIYTLATTNTTRILASKNPTEVGQPGTEAELAAIQSGAVSFGREKGQVLVTLPLFDRNGENIAAVRVRLNSFWGETQDNAVNRASLIRKMIQAQCSSGEELLK